ncbi:chemotaxis protein CheB [Shinella sp. HZN7]|uniref:chemotaxis protein CheB n=1 Tax=Shinella sp. (strain HZN7) TaxID=879274 RepID=UPI00352A7DEB
MLLPPLPATYPYPIFVVVHLPPNKRSVLAAIFDLKCQLRAIEAEDKEPVQAGFIYFAPPNYHLSLEGERMSLYPAKKRSSSRGPRSTWHSRARQMPGAAN